MAQSGAQLNRELLSCCLCLDLLKDPVSTSCGHSYCRRCLQLHWDVEEETRFYSCPQCRKTFTTRPVLQKNTLLAALVETLEKTGLQVAPADHHYAGLEDVACDFCTGRKLKALKSCLVCRASYCDSHLQPHRDVAALQRHKLADPSQELLGNNCPHHDEVMKMFCLTDQQRICFLCSVDEHRGHDTVSAASERTERQKELWVTRKKIQRKIQYKEEDLKVLQKEVKSINDSADKAVRNNDSIFTQIISLLEKRRFKIQQQIRSTQEAEVSRVKDLQKKQEQQIAELKRRDTELEKLSQTLDHSQFLHKFSSLPALSQSPDSSRLEIHPLRCFEDVAAAVTKLRDEIQEVLKKTPADIAWTSSPLCSSALDKRQPSCREDFLRYSRQVTMDPNTANGKLLLSEENRKVTCMEEAQSYRYHSDRFTVCQQVLSTESLSGRCYWEVKWKGRWVGIAVTYRNISRSGWLENSGFGFNKKSWRLYCSSGEYAFNHNANNTNIPGPQPSRIEVYLDHTAGLLCFYSVSGTMELLHRVQTTFTEPLHAGLWVGPDSSIELLKL